MGFLVADFPPLIAAVDAGEDDGCGGVLLGHHRRRLAELRLQLLALDQTCSLHWHLVRPVYTLDCPSFGNVCVS